MAPHRHASGKNEVSSLWPAHGGSRPRHLFPPPRSLFPLLPRPPPTKSPRKKAKKKGLCRASRQLKREVMRETLLNPKAIAQLRTSQSTPIRVNFKMVSHPAVTLTRWMGLREPAAKFKPEAREYSFDKARQIPGMVVLDCQGKLGPLVDANGYVFALFGTQPRDPGWAKGVVELAAKLMEEAAANMYDHVFSGVYYGTRNVSNGLWVG
ncbi:hypothetical protein B0H14DRAFT_3526326 [Mycena olivaceomarginata]|nr:hypothetical protein B0H14DRAFT_3526326 [Mycena olivaceomarginata]